MDFIIEFFFEVLLEGIVELTFNKKVTKWIRIPCFLLTILIFTMTVGFLFFLGIVFVKRNIWISLFFLGVLSIFLIEIIKKGKNIIKKK